MSFEDNPQDERTEIDLCLEEIKRLKAEVDAKVAAAEEATIEKFRVAIDYDADYEERENMLRRLLQSPLGILVQHDAEVRRQERERWHKELHRATGIPCDGVTPKEWHE